MISCVPFALETNKFFFEKGEETITQEVTPPTPAVFKLGDSKEAVSFLGDGSTVHDADMPTPDPKTEVELLKSPTVSPPAERRTTSKPFPQKAKVSLGLSLICALRLYNCLYFWESGDGKNYTYAFRTVIHVLYCNALNCYFSTVKIIRGNIIFDKHQLIFNHFFLQVNVFVNFVFVLILNILNCQLCFCLKMS